MKKKNKKFWNIKKKEDDDKIGQIDIYGDISNNDWWGDNVTPTNFKKDLDSLGEIETLDIYVNSGGGEVFAGQAIFNIIKRHKATKNVYIDGLAASIASIIAMAGDKVIMPENALMMIHNPATFVWGDAKELSSVVEKLEKVKSTLIDVYAKKSGLDDEEISKMMDDETWFTASEAKEKGFVDEVQEGEEIAAKLIDNSLFINDVKVDFSNYKNAPQIEIKEEPKKIKAIKIDNSIEDLMSKLKNKKNKYN